MVYLAESFQFFISEQKHKKFYSVDTKSGDDHKPPQRSINVHKPPATDHKPPANHHKPPANHHKRPIPIIQLFCKLEKRRSLTDVNKHRHLTSLSNLIFVHLTQLMTYRFISFFNKSLPSFPSLIACFSKLRWLL